MKAAGQRLTQGGVLSLAVGRAMLQATEHYLAPDEDHSVRRRVIVVVDACDELTQTNEAHSMDWLPSEVRQCGRVWLWECMHTVVTLLLVTFQLPVGVRFIVSVSEGSHCANALHSRGQQPLWLTLTSHDDRHDLVTKMLADYRKKLTKPQVRQPLDHKAAQECSAVAVAHTL